MDSSKLKQEVTQRTTQAGAILHDIDTINKNKRDRFNAKNDYKIDHLSYPIDLFGANSPNKDTNEITTKYGSNYVIFYINVNEDSKLLKQTGSVYDTQTVSDWTPQDQGRLAGRKVTNEQVVGAAAIEGAIIGGALTSGDVEKMATGAGVNALGVGVIGLAANGFTKQKKRLTTAIALYEPANLTAKYSANWEAESTAPFQMALKGSETIGQVVDGKGDGKQISDTAKNIGAAIALNMAAGKDAASVMTGLAPNPKKEQIFRGVDFRSWSFEYQFFPRSMKEYQNVQNIIYLFKLHMQPEFKDEDSFLYLYPSEFDIVHYNGVEENLHLPKHTSCVLTDLTVNYSPQQQFTSFEGGIPAQINIQLSFRELIQMSKERIMEGY